MRQEELAALVPVTRLCISPLKTGHRTDPPLPVLQRLAKALGVGVGELVG